MKKGYIECPFCGEEIREGAIKCRYCREFLEGDEKKEKQTKNDSGKKSNKEKEHNNKYGSLRKWGIILVIIFVIGLIGSLLIKTIQDGSFGRYFNSNSITEDEDWNRDETEDRELDLDSNDDLDLDLDLNLDDDSEVDLDLDNNSSYSKNKNLIYEKMITRIVLYSICFFFFWGIISIVRFLFKKKKPKSGFIYKNKSQYSDESLHDNNIGENIEESNSTSQNTENKTKSWYENIRLYVVIGFLLLGIINIIHQSQQRNAQNKINDMYDTIIQQSGDVSNINFNEYLDVAKTAFNNKYADEYLGGLQKIQNEYRKNIELIGDLDFEENYKLKDVSLLNEIISNWKAYKTANTQYENDFSILNEEYMKQFGESEESKLAMSKTSDFFSSMNKRADVNIELYSYIVSIQNDFYVNDNDEIVFYKKGNSFYKYNDLIEKWGDESEIFNKAYSDYQNFYVEFLKNAKRF